MIDPISGNAVPPGAMPKEVRDDVPINASEGEYVLPANVVRYLGLDKIEKLVKQAEEGIAQMGQGGRIGGEPPMPAPAPGPEAPMFSEGGLVMGKDFDDRGIPLAFQAGPYLEGQGNGQERVQKYIGPNGRILYIPLNAAGQLVFDPPEGFALANEPPKTVAEARQEIKFESDSGDDPMWSDGLTPTQIREEQQNRTFRTAEQINAPANTGQMSGAVGELLGGIGGRIKGAFEKLTSGEALGGIAQVVFTLGTKNPLIGRVVGELVDSFNAKRKAEGQPEMTVEEVVAKAAPTVSLSTSDLQEIAKNAPASPSNYRTTEPLDGPPTADNVQEAATQRIDFSGDLPEGYMVLGKSGTDANPIALIQTPEGVKRVTVGDKIGDFTIEAIDLNDPDIQGGITVKGGKSEGIAPVRDPFQQSMGILGRGLQSPGVQTPLGTSGRSDSTTAALAPRGLSPTSSGVSFNTSGYSSSDQQGPDPSASTAGARTSSGASISGPAASAGFSQGESTVGRTGTGTGSVASSFTDQYGSVGTTAPSSVGFSMGESVSGRYNKGGLVASPYKDYDVTKGYKKGGLVKRKK